MHGLLSSADDWITPGPDSGIGYLLAKAGYDVWMGNARGNKHSRRHIHLSPDRDRKQFWDFSWDEIGRYDLPALIDCILCTTNKTTLRYVGHSQGTTSFYVMASLRPEYNDKIALMVAMSPVAWMTHIKSPLARIISPFKNFLFSLTNFIGLYEFLPNSGFMKSIQMAICSKVALAYIFCSNIMFLLFGFNYKQLNVTRIPVIYAHIPSGAATKQIMHYGQEIVSGKFRRFDYGSGKNMEIYGFKDPPEYPLEKVTAPVALFYSIADWMSNATDVAILRRKLRNVVDVYRVPDKKFNHLDFLYAKDIETLILPRLLQVLQRI